MPFKITKSDTWYTNIVNFMVAGYVPPGENKRKLIYESRLHIWDAPYLFRVCSDGLLRRCVPTEEGIMGHSALIQRFGKVDSFGQPYMKIQRTLSGDVEHVRGMGISIQEMPCHSPTTSRSRSSMSGELTTWDRFQNQRTVNTPWWQLTMSPSGLKPCHVEPLMQRTPRRCLKK